jgi:hypothetical protein
MKQPSSAEIRAICGLNLKKMVFVPADFADVRRFWSHHRIVEEAIICGNPCYLWDLIFK